MGECYISLYLLNPESSCMFERAVTIICQSDKEEHSYDYTSASFVFLVLQPDIFMYFLQDENPDINSQNMADTDRSDVNSSDGWDEGDVVSTKLNDSVVDSELFKAQWLLYLPLASTLNNIASCPQSAFMCFE